MDIVGISYIVNFFINNEVIGSDSEALMKLMPIIQKGFMPSIGDAINNEGEREKAIQLKKEDDDISSTVTFARKAILIQITSEKLINNNLLIEKIKEILTAINENISFGKANRISSIINTIVNYNTEVENKLYTRYFNGDADCFEWSLRKAKRINIKGEEVNSITSIERGKAKKSNHLSGKTSDIDVFLITCDSNTIIENNNERFSIDDNSIISDLVKETEIRTKAIING